MSQHFHIHKSLIRFHNLLHIRFYLVMFVLCLLDEEQLGLEFIALSAGWSSFPVVYDDFQFSMVDQIKYELFTFELNVTSLHTL